MFVSKSVLLSVIAYNDESVWAVASQSDESVFESILNVATVLCLIDVLAAIHLWKQFYRMEY